MCKKAFFIVFSLFFHHYSPEEGKKMGISTMPNLNSYAYGHEA